MKLKWLLKTTAIALLIAVAFIGLASHDSVMAAQGEGDKIESLLLDRYTANGSADFIVIMTEQADVSAAAQKQTKLEKGQYVFDTLVATADRTQVGLRSYLDSQGATYKTYYIINAILVKGGNLDLAMAIAARPDVAQITAIHTYQLEKPINPQPSSVEPLAIEPNLTFINVDDVWVMGITGAGTVLAGNDTGIDETHPAIAPHYRGCLNPPTCSSWDHNYNWWDATGTYPTNPYDGFGHGTHTEGTMVGDDLAGNQIGVAPGAQTIHCKNLDDGGGGDDTTIMECFQWDLAPWDLSGANPQVAMAPDAVNNSWGYSGGGYNIFRTIINNLQASGILIEVSAGNEGSYCSTLRSPGDYQEVLTTGSIDHIGQTFPGTITGFSSRGPSSLDPGFFPDIMAPGNGIRSSLPGGTYASWSGTSMAGPHATALVGLMWSACPSLSGLVDITDQMIRDTAAPLTGQNGSNCGGDYTTGPNNDWGMGTIDAQAAVQAAIVFCGGAEIGHLNGYVYDEVGSPVEGASVTASPAIEGAQVDSVTDPTGFYTMDLLVGTYNVTASKVNYTPQTVYGVEVLADQTTSQDFSITFLGAWTQIALPAGCPDWYRYDGQFFAGTGLVYFMGGRPGADTDGSIWSFDPVGLTCTDTNVDMPVPISNYTIVPVNNGSADLLCTFGGRDNAGGYSTAVQCYDPLANTASQLSTLPGDLGLFIPGGAAVVDNIAYVFSGFRNTASPYHTAQTWGWEPISNTWTQYGDVGIGRGYIDNAVVDGKIYGFGGDTFDGTNLVPQTISEVFDPATGLWDDLAVADLPTASGEGRAYGFDSGSGYLFAGQIVIAGGGVWPAAWNEVELYDIATDSYDYSFPNLNTLRRDHAGFFVPGDPGRMWVFGGWAGADAQPFGPPEYYEVPRVVVGPFDQSYKLATPQVLFGETIHYTVVIENSGDVPALDTTMTDVVPAGTTFVPGSLTCDSGDCSYDAGTNTVSWFGEVGPANGALDVTIPSAPVGQAQGLAGLALPAGEDGQVDSLSGSNITFFPSAGGDACYVPGETQTFCFRSESFTNDWEYRYNEWLKFPSDWVVTDAYQVGTPVCDGGGSWGPFSWSFETASYELNINDPAYQAYTDHCVDTYCVDVVAGTGGPSALESWYFDGDGYNTAPHHPCSSDVYTPGSMGSEPCDEAVAPQAAIPICQTVLVDQQPNQSNGLFADASCDYCGDFAQSIAENFAVEAQATIEQIVLWSGYYPTNTPLNPDMIRVLIHQDAGGVPGPVVYDESNITYSRFQTGVVLFGVNEWKHTLTLGTPAVLPAGNYWIELYNNSGFGGFDFFWEVGNSDTMGRGLTGSTWAVETPGVAWNYDGATELAMQLVGTIEEALINPVTIQFDVTANTCGRVDNLAVIDDPVLPAHAEVTDYTQVQCADLTVEPMELTEFLRPNETQTQQLNVCNVGDLPLDWTLAEVPGMQAEVVTPVTRQPANPTHQVTLSLEANGVSGPTAPAPANTEATVSLVLDDGSRDNDIGLGGTIEMLWVNRFTPDPTEFPFTLNQIQIYFSSVGLVNPGDDIVLIIYENTSGNNDPAVGSNFLAAYPTTIQALDTWNVYDLAIPVQFNGPGDVIIGAIGMETPGTSYWPASMDQTATQARSWAGWWNASPPPTPPLLPPENWTLIDAYFPGNWMVRGYGETGGGGFDVPWLSEDTTSGTINPGDPCTVINVTFDSAGLVVGDYFAGLQFDSNDSLEPVVTVPVTLHVVDFSMEKVAPAVAWTGDTIPYTVTVDFQPNLFGTAVLTDVIPAGATYVPDSLTCDLGTCSYDPGTNTVTWTNSLQNLLIPYPPGEKNTLPYVPPANIPFSLSVNGTVPAANQPASVPEDVLWDQYALSSTAFAAQDFEPTNDVYDIYAADDFQNNEAWDIDSILTAGGWGGPVDLLNATALHFYIYADNGGEPAGVPGDGFELWSITLPPTDPQIALGTVDAQSVLLTLDTPITLPPGNWWLVYYVSLEFSSYGQYGWQGSTMPTWGVAGEQNNPGGGFGLPLPGWNVNSYGSDFSFRLEGSVVVVVPSVVTISFDALVTSQGDPLVNTADLWWEGLTGSITATTEVLYPEIGLAKTVGTEAGVCATTDTIIVPPGTEVTYCYTVTNTGNVLLTTHDLVDSELGQLLTDEPHDLAPAASWFVLETATIDADTVNDATWTAWADELHSAEATATATVTISQADLVITKAAPETAFVGDLFEYTLVVTNLGPDGATDVVVVDTLPEGITFDNASPGCVATLQVVTCTIGNLPMDGEVTLTIGVIADTVGTFTNTATVSGNVIDPVPGNNTATAVTTVTVEPADLAITKTGTPDPVYVGGTLTYVLTVENLGTNDATGVTVVDTLPAGVTFVSASAVCTQLASVITCAVGDLAADATTEITIVVLAPAVVGTITNTATVAGNEPDPVVANNTATAETSVVALPELFADLGITKADSPDPVYTGEALTYVLVVTNDGPDAATGVTVVDTLPAGVTFEVATAGCVAEGLVVTCDLGALAVDASVEITIVVTAPAVEGLITNTATVSGNEGDPDTENNTATTTTEVIVFVPPVENYLIYLPIIFK